jgi:DNA-binding transcriptional LysR family regulator
MISIDNLKHFVAVVENQGVIRGAEKLFISASSVTRSIQQIEAELGKPLFDRVSRTVNLNQEGMRFYERARELLYQYALLLNEEDRTGELRGHYKIGASHFLSEALLCDIVQKVTTKNKKTSIEVYSFDSNVLVKKIHEGEVDLGFSFSPKISEAMDFKKIHEGQLRLCASKKHPLIGKPFSDLRKELSHYRAIIHRPSESIDRCDNHPMFTKFKIKPPIQVYWDSDYFALGLLARSDFWSMLPDYVLRLRGDVTPFAHPKDWEAPYEIDMLWNKRKSMGELKDAILALL